MSEKELVERNAIKREKGYMYYLNADGDIYRTKMGRKKKEAVEVTA